MHRPTPLAHAIGCCIFFLITGTAAPVFASGLERTSQSLSALFEKGRYLAVDGYVVRPSVHGRDALGYTTGNITPSHSQMGFGYKQDLTPQVSMALMLTRPFGLDIAFNRQASPLFGGTLVSLSTLELQGVGRYRFNPQWSVHGGLRLQQSEGEVAFRGLAYGAGNGYHVKFARSTAPGYLLGMAYEQPEIALRVAATYYSAIKHQLPTTENAWLGVTQTSATSPQTFNLDLQTGISRSSLLFGQIRWGNWEQFQLRPTAFAAATQGASLTNLHNSLTYTLGLAHKLAPRWTGVFALAYDKSRRETPMSPLEPGSGKVGYSLGLVYDNQVVKIHPWIGYKKLGSTQGTDTPALLSQHGSSSIKAMGLQLGYYF